MTADDKARRKALRDAYKRDQQRSAWTALTLDRTELDSLLDHLDERLGEQSCDHSLRFSREWAERQRRPWEPLAAALGEAGGHCDCEVLANVDPDG